MTKKAYDLDDQCINESAGEEQLEILHETIPATRDFKTTENSSVKSEKNLKKGNSM